MNKMKGVGVNTSNMQKKLGYRKRELKLDPLNT